MSGHAVPLSRARRLTLDLLHFAARVPSVPVQRRMKLGELIRARRESANRPSWTAIFVKAMGRMSAETPEFRRAYLSFPWPHLHEFDEPTASVAVEREIDGEKAVMFGRLKRPHEAPLDELSDRLHHFGHAPIDEVPEFRRGLRLAGFPRILRRSAWWLALNRPEMRRRHLGTFGVSVYAALGAESLHPLSPLTTLLNYGVFRPSGDVDVRLVYDHRVMDGATVARGLARLEDLLRDDLLQEVRGLEPADRTLSWMGA